MAPAAFCINARREIPLLKIRIRFLPITQSVMMRG
jgi:hypothetical protein